MKLFPKAFTCPVLLLAAALPWHHLAAQTLSPVFAPANLPALSTAKPQKPAVLDTAPPNRVYVGTVTRTSPTGQTTTGSLEMSVTPEGRVTANFTYNNKVHPYYGAVKPAASDTNATAGEPHRRTGGITTTYLFDNSGPGSVPELFEEASLTVTPGKAYGGNLPTTDHSTLSFTALRLHLGSLTFGTVFPVGTVPASGSVHPITVVPTAGQGG